MIKKRLTFDEFHEKAMQDEEFRKEYELVQPEFEILHKLIRARKKAECSQVELAERLKMQQPAIARLEKGGYTTTTIGKLARVADALGYSIKISLSPKKTQEPKNKLVAKKTKSNKV